MNFEIRLAAVKKFIYQGHFESLDDEELEQISKLKNMTAYRLSVSKLLPRIKADDIRQLLIVEQLRRKRKVYDPEEVEYDPKKKRIETHPYEEVTRLTKENEDLKHFINSCFFDDLFDLRQLFVCKFELLHYFAYNITIHANSNLIIMVIFP